MNRSNFYTLQEHYERRDESENSHVKEEYFGRRGWWFYIFGNKHRVKIGGTSHLPTARLKQIFGSFKNIPDDLEIHAFNCQKWKGIGWGTMEDVLKTEIKEFIDWESRRTHNFGNSHMHSGWTEVYLMSFDNATAIAHRALNKLRSRLSSGIQLKLPFEESV